MGKIVDYPLLVFVISFIGLWLSACLGAFLCRKQLLHEGVRDDFGVVLAASLTLPAGGLICVKPQNLESLAESLRAPFGKP